MKTILVLAVLFGAAAAVAASTGGVESDTYDTSSGPLSITFLGHGSLLFAHAGRVVYVDPYGKVADYGALPPADLVLITHEHGDHLDPDALAKVTGERTVVIANPGAAAKISGARELRNGESGAWAGFPVEAVPAYNLLHRRPGGEPYHPRGVGNGYVVTFGNLRVYVAGDTENVPEMRDLGEIDIAFIPMNLPYTMTVEMAANAARIIRPRVLYPYHFGESDTSDLLARLAGEAGMEVKIRSMQ